MSKLTFESKLAYARSMLCGGAVMEVRNLQEAILAESAGARCVLVATPSPTGGRCIPFNGLIDEIKGHLSIPVMARTRVGHTKEAEALVSIGCQFLDESELLNVADEDYFLNKHDLRIPCCCGCQNLSEALKRVGEGAAIIRIQGETSRSRDISKTVKNLRSVLRDVWALKDMDNLELRDFSARTRTPLDFVEKTQRLGRLPVPALAGGGIATVDDALLLVDLGCDGVFVGSEIFDTKYPYLEMRSIVEGLDIYRSRGY